MRCDSDDELFRLARRHLYTAVVGDIMDKLGLVHQFLSPRIQPIRQDMVVVGRAMTVLEADVFAPAHPGSANPLLSQPFGLMLQALDDLKHDEVYLCTGSSPRYALWGELMSTRAMQLGAAGAVVDGYSRDTRAILELGFPTFSYGRFAQDQGPRGKVIDFRVPLEFQGVRVAPGDIVFGDMDGVCVIPRAAEQDVLAGAFEKAEGEQAVKKAIEAGMGALEAFRTFGIM
jgi:regulator of RNase E activity RraA